MAGNASVKVQFEESPDFLNNKDVREGFLEYTNGAWVFSANGGLYKQVLKWGDYRKLMIASGQGDPGPMPGSPEAKAAEKSADKKK